MKFVFSGLFYTLVVIGLVPLSLSWNLPLLRWIVFLYDALLIVAAIADYFLSRRLPDGFSIRREFDRRFAIGDSSKVTLRIENPTSQSFHIRIKDEFPAEMRLDETREADFTIGAQSDAEFT